MTKGLLINEEEDTFALRQLFVEAVLSDEYGITSFIEGSVEDVLMKAREFRTKGIFDREIGDVVLRVCCNILQIPILVITSSHAVPYLSFKCDQSVTNEPIFIAFHYYGAGHYDATEGIVSGKGFLGYNNCHFYYENIKIDVFSFQFFSIYITSIGHTYKAKHRYF